MQQTRIVVEQRAGRHRAVLANGLLRAQQVHSRPGWCRVGLLAGTALLLGGDAVDLQVSVGPGACLDLFEVAGTVAYDGRGRSASWRVCVELADGATLRLSGEPFVVAGGADVRRSLVVDLAGSARALLRDTVVLGRSGEHGGRLRSRTEVVLDGRPVCIEDQHLDPDTRSLPGMLGDCRIVDTITSVGDPTLEPVCSGATAFRLTGRRGVLCRHLGHELAASPLHAEWDRLTAALVKRPPSFSPALQSV